MKLIMTKPSPQLIRSAAISALAMATFALAAPALEARDGEPAIATIELPSLAATAGSLVR